MWATTLQVRLSLVRAAGGRGFAAQVGGELLIICPAQPLAECAARLQREPGVLNLQLCDAMTRPQQVRDRFIIRSPTGLRVAPGADSPPRTLRSCLDELIPVRTHLLSVACPMMKIPPRSAEMGTANCCAGCATTQLPSARHVERCVA